jgi:hypothetical protein
MLIHVNHDDGNTYTADVPDDAEYVVIFTDKVFTDPPEHTPKVNFIRDNEAIRLKLSVKPTMLFG